MTQPKTDTKKKGKKAAAAAPAPAAPVERAARKTVTGTVVSDKMTKTRVVNVERRFRHSFYEKVMKRTSRFYAHDEENASKTGDIVEIMETRPLSRLKRWRVIRIVEKAKVAA